MVSLTREPGEPRALLGMWALLLLAPLAWATALSVLFSLTDETCVSGSRLAMWFTATASIALAAAPAFPAAWWRRRMPPSSASRERARFMLDVALGGSLLFTLITALSAVPIALLDSCRT